MYKDLINFNLLGLFFFFSTSTKRAHKLTVALIKGPACEIWQRRAVRTQICGAEYLSSAPFLCQGVWEIRQLLPGNHINNNIFLLTARKQ